MDPASIFLLVPQRPFIDHLMSVLSCKKDSFPRYVSSFLLRFFFSYTKKVPSPNIFSFSFYVFLLLKRRLHSPNGQGWTRGPV